MVVLLSHVRTVLTSGGGLLGSIGAALISQGGGAYSIPSTDWSRLLFRPFSNSTSNSCVNSSVDGSDGSQMLYGPPMSADEGMALAFLMPLTQGSSMSMGRGEDGKESMGTISVTRIQMLAVCLVQKHRQLLMLQQKAKAGAAASVMSASSSSSVRSAAASATSTATASMTPLLKVADSDLIKCGTNDGDYCATQLLCAYNSCLMNNRDIGALVTNRETTTTFLRQSLNLSSTPMNPLHEHRSGSNIHPSIHPITTVQFQHISLTCIHIYSHIAAYTDTFLHIPTSLHDQ